MHVRPLRFVQSCMGGGGTKGCSKRDHCPHYHAASEGQIPVERLCEPGFDGLGATEILAQSDWASAYLQHRSAGAAS